MDDIVQQILEENDFVVKQIPDGSYSLMRAISNCLYFSSGNWKQIQEQCVRFLKHMVQQKKVPDILNSFTSNITLFNDYVLEPSKPDYHKVKIFKAIIFGVIGFIAESYFLQTKVQVYYVSEENQLHSFIINNRYKRKIEMIYANSHYNPLFSRKFIQLIILSQGIVQKIVDQSMGCERKYPEKFVNFEYEHWFAERISQFNEVEQQAVPTSNSAQAIHLTPLARVKRSLSDNFNKQHQDQNQSEQLAQPQEQESVPVFEVEQEQKINVNPERKPPSISGIRLDVSMTQGIERRPILSPIYFVKSTPPGISPKPTAEKMNGASKQFDWKNSEENEEEEDSSDSDSSLNMRKSLSSQNHQQEENNSSSKKLIGNLCSTTAKKGEKELGLHLSQFAIKKVDRVQGSLKFFDEQKKFGFFVLEDGSDIFIHLDDLEKAGVNKEKRDHCIEKKTIFSFQTMKENGRQKEQKKAVDIQVIYEDYENEKLSSEIMHNPPKQQQKQFSFQNQESNDSSPSSMNAFTEDQYHFNSKNESKKGTFHDFNE